jgi:spermidine/putrescine-binding protein
MFKKRAVMLLGLLVLLGLVVSGCSSQPAATAAPQATSNATETQVSGAIEPAKEIVLYNWTDYMNPEVLTQFEEETGIKIVEDYFSSNEELIAKLQGGATGYSLIIPSDYAVYVLIQNNLLAKLDQANLPNTNNLSERFKNPEVDPGNQYCVPYEWGTTGIGYRTDLVDPPTSWATILAAKPGDPQYGRMTMVDDVRDGFAAALMYLGYDINTTDEAQVQEARDLLIQAKSGLSGYDSDTFEDLVASGENVLAHGYSGEFQGARDENPYIDYLIPDEGGVIYMEEICIPVTASPEEKLAAEMFINYLLRGDIGAQLSEYIYYGSPNKAATEYLSQDYLANPIINPSEEVMQRLNFIKPLGEFDLVYQRLWDEVKSAPTP